MPVLCLHMPLAEFAAGSDSEHARSHRPVIITFSRLRIKIDSEHAPRPLYMRRAIWRGLHAGN